MNKRRLLCAGLALLLTACAPTLWADARKDLELAFRYLQEYREDPLIHACFKAGYAGDEGSVAALRRIANGIGALRYREKALALVSKEGGSAGEAINRFYASPAGDAILRVLRQMRSGAAYCARVQKALQKRERQGQ